MHQIWLLESLTELFKFMEARRKRARQRVLDDLKELAKPLSDNAITLPWKRRMQDKRQLSKDFGDDNDEWVEAFDAGFDPIKCHNALKDFHGLFDWCTDNYWKEFYIARSWNCACFVSETRRGKEDIGVEFKRNPPAYRPISNKWLELMPDTARIAELRRLH